MLCIYIFIYLLLNQINVYQLVMNWKGPYKFSKVSKILETLLLMLLVLYFIIIIIIIIIIILILILGFTRTFGTTSQFLNQRTPLSSSRKHVVESIAIRSLIWAIPASIL
jgi:hypothetical protein